MSILWVVTRDLDYHKGEIDKLKKEYNENISFHTKEVKRLVPWIKNLKKSWYKCYGKEWEGEA